MFAAGCAGAVIAYVYFNIDSIKEQQRAAIDKAMSEQATNIKTAQEKQREAIEKAQREQAEAIRRIKDMNKWSPSYMGVNIVIYSRGIPS